MKLFVAGLPSDFDDVDLKEMFELYGEVRSAKIVIDRATGKTKGFGFVDMANKAEALETIEALDGAGLPRGKKIVVKEAEEQQRPSTGGPNRSSNFGGPNRSGNTGGYNRSPNSGGYNRNSTGNNTGYNRNYDQNNNNNNNTNNNNRNNDLDDDNRFNRL